MVCFSYHFSRLRGPHPRTPGPIPSFICSALFSFYPPSLMPSSVAGVHPGPQPLEPLPPTPPSARHSSEGLPAGKLSIDALRPLNEPLFLPEGTAPALAFAAVRSYPFPAPRLMPLFAIAVSPPPNGMVVDMHQVLSPIFLSN